MTSWFYLIPWQRETRTLLMIIIVKIIIANIYWVLSMCQEPLKCATFVASSNLHDLLRRRRLRYGNTKWLSEAQKAPMWRNWDEMVHRRSTGPGSLCKSALGHDTRSYRHSNHWVCQGMNGGRSQLVARGHLVICFLGIDPRAPLLGREVWGFLRTYGFWALHLEFIFVYDAKFATLCSPPPL